MIRIIEKLNVKSEKLKLPFNYWFIINLFYGSGIWIWFGIW
jgi:hypothetical protein